MTQLDSEHLSNDILEQDWVFGYGSIMNNLSRSSTAGSAGSHHQSSAKRAVFAYLEPSFGMVRSWNFRSTTGFTAVGLRQREESEPEARTCGVLFAASGAMSAFDERERGYQRVKLSSASLTISQGAHEDSNAQTILVEALILALAGPSPPNLWMYVPLSSSCHAPNENFPICQTYVDTVLQGCLCWGGAALAREWVTTTFGWSAYFLNDAPLSRRPWLHRPRHTEIDEVLVQYSDWTRFSERRHPEEFASHWMSGLRGMWGVPPRNPDFVGRDTELFQIRDALSSSGAPGLVGTSGVTTIETVGLGGVGKTQMAIEYCHRHYQTTSDTCTYGLILWLVAESPDSIAAGFRDLASDSGIAVKDMHNEEIVEKVRSRLYRTSCQWLLVFDNVENREVLDAYMPRGGVTAGHVLVTTRYSLPGVPSSRRISLDCFSKEESISFLHRVVGGHAVDEMVAGADCRGPVTGLQRPETSGGTFNAVVGDVLAHALGHLPLALAMAAAYMIHCDVTCAEYLNMLQAAGNRPWPCMMCIDQQKLAGYPLGIRESLSLSLQRMTQEEMRSAVVSITAEKVLGCLSFLAPDGITKSLVSLILGELESRAKQSSRTSSSRIGSMLCKSQIRISGTLLFLSLLVWLGPKLRSRCRIRSMLIAVSLLASIIGVSSVSRFEALGQTSSSSLALSKSKSSDLALHSDRIWTLLKQFSLLTVRDRTGSMHRLLQQLIRQTQNTFQAQESLICCIEVLKGLWAFDPADTTCWPEAGKLLEHVKFVGQHMDHMLKDEQAELASKNAKRALQAAARSAANLLTEAALYMSMALSRFEEANSALELALRLHQFWSGQAYRTHLVGTDVARTLHTQGQVARYRGRLLEAAVHLDKALEIRKGLVKVSEIHLWDVASTLHELGVLRLKQQMLELANRLLKESLSMKRVLRGRSVPLPDARLHRFADEAATLHQLAVAAMIAKPSRLDEAEALLNEALTLEFAGNPFGRGARAASLQQLARVCIRRGHFDAAQGHLQEALTLYREAYGQHTPHVNVVAVRMQLGKVACAMGLNAKVTADRASHFAEATGHLLESLKAQQIIYGGVSADHIEIASTFGQLGLVERARGVLPAAQRYFCKQREILVRLLPDGSPFQGIDWSLSQLKRVAATAPNIDERTENLLRHILDVLQWEKIVAKDSLDAVKSKSVSEIMKLISSMLVRAGHPPESRDDLVALALSETVLCRTCMETRDQVRTILINARKNKAHVPQAVFDDVADSLARVTHMQDNQISITHHEISAEALAVLTEAAFRFQTALKDPTHDKFVACDELRGTLRNLLVPNVS